MKRVLLGLLAVALLFTASAKADIGSPSAADGFIHLGQMKMDKNGNLTQTNQLFGSNDWFRSDNFAFSFFNIGSSGTVDNANHQYVSHGQGLSGGPVVVCGFDVWYVANTVDGTLQARLDYYDGRNTANVQTPAVASFNINLPTSGGTGGNFIYSVSVTLPQNLWFTLNDPNGDFEYGLQFLAGEGPGGPGSPANFGPVLQTNIPGQNFNDPDNTINATVGTTFNVFERWTPPTQSSGAHNGGPFWFGQTGPWAGGAHSIQIVPEPGTGVALLLIATVGLIGRRRR